MESDAIARWDCEKANKHLANHQTIRNVNERCSHKQNLKALSDTKIPDALFTLTLVKKHWNAAGVLEGKPNQADFQVCVCITRIKWESNTEQEQIRFQNITH